MEFLGYERPDGLVGVRNHVVVIPAGRCSNELAATITDGVQGAMPLLHNHGCLLLKPDNERALRVITGLGCNPNVASALVVGIGLLIGWWSCRTLPGYSRFCLGTHNSNAKSLK